MTLHPSNKFPAAVQSEVLLLLPLYGSGTYAAIYVTEWAALQYQICYPSTEPPLGQYSSTPLPCPRERPLVSYFELGAVPSSALSSWLSYGARWHFVFIVGICLYSPLLDNPVSKANACTWQILPITGVGRPRFNQI